MAEPATDNDRLEEEIRALCQENARLRSAFEEIMVKLREPEEVIRAIRHGEIDALVVQEEGQEEIYSLQRFDSIYRSVVEECLPYGVWLAESDGKLLYVSRSFLDLARTDLRALREKGQFHFLPPESREQADRDWKTSRESGEACNVEYTVRLDDGSERTIWTHGILSRTQDGLPYWVGVNLDVTGRKQAEEALRLSEERFRLLADAMPQIVWVTRPDGYHEHYNQRWYDYIGCTPEQCVGHGWSLPLHPDDHQRAIDVWNHALSTGEPYEIEYRFRSKHGEYRWFLARALPVRDEAGQIVRWFGTCTDIDDKKKMEQELREQAEALKEADRRKDDFLATLAHELRNPLAPIHYSLQIMRLGGGDAQAVDEARSMMERQLQQMVRLIDDLLDVSRITQGKLQLRKERVELAATVLGAVEATRPLIESNGLELIVMLPPEPIHFDADSTRLAQVLTNLLNNAAKFSEPGGHVRLNAERQGTDVVVSVRDEGIGIAAEHLPRLFEIFSQVGPALERSQGGLGIGLSLVKGLVEMHGGRVEARSKGIGRGSEFLVRLPIFVEPPKPRGANQANGVGEAEPASSGRRILVVDDMRDSANSLSRLLRLMGHETRTAHDGVEALEVAQAYCPEVILMDIGMPLMNGYDAARRIREQAWSRGMVLVALTGWGQEEDKRRAEEAGFDRHLVKPVDPDDLSKLLAEMEPGPS